MTVQIREPAVDDHTGIVEVPVASRARVTRLRVAPTRIGTAAKVAGGTTTTLLGWLVALLSRFAGTEDAWDTTPRSPREVLEYTRSGEWVPGEQAPWLEFLGKAYGNLIALPVTIAAFAVVWVVQAPSRFALVTLIVVLGWLGSGLILP